MDYVLSEVVFPGGSDRLTGGWKRYMSVHLVGRLGALLEADRLKMLRGRQTRALERELRDFRHDYTRAGT